MMYLLDMTQIWIMIIIASIYEHYEGLMGHFHASVGPL